MHIILYHIPKNTGQAARKKCRKAIYAKEEFAEFKDWMKSEVKFVLKKKWWMVGSVDHLPLHLWSLLMEFGRLKRRRTTSSGLFVRWVKNQISYWIDQWRQSNLQIARRKYHPDPVSVSPSSVFNKWYPDPTAPQLVYILHSEYIGRLKWYLFCFLKLVSFHNVCIVLGSQLPFSSKFHETYLGQFSQFLPV